MSNTIYKSEIFIDSVGMLVVSWKEIPTGFRIELIEGPGGENKNCLLQIIGFDVVLARALTRRTQQIKAARNAANLSSC
jgi:hypothetical protein